jgi:hypothetical protein
VIAVTGLGVVERDFCAEDFIQPNRLRRMDPLSVRAVVAAWLAVRDAGLTGDLGDLGIAFGTVLGCQETTLRYAQKLVEQGAYFTNPIDFPDSIDGAPAAHIALELGLQGPSTTLVSGVLSGEHAVAHAAAAIQAGHAPRMLAGSGDEVTSLPWTVGCGTLAPGAAVLVLEPAALARERGARIHAELAGVGYGSDPSCPPYRWPRDPALCVASMQAAGAAAAAAVSIGGVCDVERQACRLALPAARVLEYPELRGVLRIAHELRAVPHETLLHHGLSQGGESVSLRLVRP